MGVTPVLDFDDLSVMPGLRHRRRYEAFGSAHGTVWFFSPEMIGSGPRSGLAGSVSTAPPSAATTRAAAARPGTTPGGARPRRRTGPARRESAWAVRRTSDGYRPACARARRSVPRGGRRPARPSCRRRPRKAGWPPPGNRPNLGFLRPQPLQGRVRPGRVNWWTSASRCGSTTRSVISSGGAHWPCTRRVARTDGVLAGRVMASRWCGVRPARRIQSQARRRRAAAVPSARRW